jgi:hypothetical protein
VRAANSDPDAPFKVRNGDGTWSEAKDGMKNKHHLILVGSRNMAEYEDFQSFQEVAKRKEAREAREHGRGSHQQ